MNKLVHAALNGTHTPTAFTPEDDYIAAVTASGGTAQLHECICTGVVPEAPSDLLIAIYVPGAGMMTARLDREAMDLLAYSMANVINANAGIGQARTSHGGDGYTLNFGTLQ